MTKAEKDRINQALGEFDLIAGVGDADSKTACAMTLLSWICGRALVPTGEFDPDGEWIFGWKTVGKTEDWSDHPQCAHPIIADNVVKANDHPATTQEMKADLVRAGEKGVLDTWWIPGETLAAALVLADGEDAADVYGRTMRLLARVAEWKDGPKERADLRGAVLSGAVLRGAVLRGADLRGADLREADLRGAVLRGADLSEADLRGADLSEADLREADLHEAVGDALTQLPDRWKVSESGLVVPS